ncbi:MAG: ImmA/IrrE family metallo-endopeptidase [Planctomycetes bacterium]|nr:ImmA/IrrE family metallo-endopeptidase [Planctomycetota bacterium]
MGIGIDITYRDYEEIRKIADEFLVNYHSSGTIPVPIEEIAEFQLKLDIIPIPGLQKVIETDGFTYGNRTAIAVDQFIYDGRPSRYRFTLAHEIGHIIMHSQYFEYKVDSIEKWQEYINRMPDKQYRMMEYQANCFAGLVLVPGNKLKELIPSVIEDIKRTEGYSELSKDYIWEIIESYISSTLEVSNQAIYIRIEKDKIKDRFVL